MTDLEITRLCAEAMGYHYMNDTGTPAMILTQEGLYRPLHDDAQAMALVKKFNLHIGKWDSGWACEYRGQVSTNADLNRAICECVAKLQATRGA